MATLFQDAASLEMLCRDWRIRRLSLFGSRSKGRAGPDSDIDLLVEFEPGAKPGLIGISKLQLAFSDILGGAVVDLRTAEDLSPFFRDEILRTATAQYAA